MICVVKQNSFTLYVLRWRILTQVSSGGPKVSSRTEGRENQRKTYFELHPKYKEGYIQRKN